MDLSSTTATVTTTATTTTTSATTATTTTAIATTTTTTTTTTASRYTLLWIHGEGEARVSFRSRRARSCIALVVEMLSTSSTLTFYRFQVDLHGSSWI